MTAQNPQRDDRTLVRLLAELERRVKSLETAPRAGHTSISNGKLLVMDPATGNVIASLAGTSGTDAYGNAYPTGLGADVGSVNGGIVQPGTIDATKVNFTARDLSGITTTTSATAPASPLVGDLWIDTANGNVLKRWDGTTWPALPVGTNAIQAGAVTASQIAANTITAGQIAAGAITASTIAAGAIDGKVITGATILTDSATGGFFVYSGTPTTGNLIVSVASASGIDAFGNSYPQGLNVTQGEIDGTTINAASLTAGSLSSGNIGSSVIVGSDIQGGTIENATITFDSNGGALLVYASTTNTQTFTSSGTYTVPAGITGLKVECWGAGAGGKGGSNGTFGSGGGGGGGGGYAKLNALAVTPGNSYSYVVGAGGSAGPNTGGHALGNDGGDSSFNSTSCIAKGGSKSGPGGGDPATGGSNVGDVTFAGGAGGSASGLGGAGGGGSAGPSSSGHPGPNNTGAGSGAGGTAVTDGGAGGAGGLGGSVHNGAAGGAPGGAGGGGTGAGGTNAVGAGGAGARGQVRVSYTTANVLIASISGVAGTDGFGNSYPAGISGSQVTIAGTDVTGAWQTYTPTWTAGTTNPTLGNGTITGRYMRIGKTVHVTISLTIGSTTTTGAGGYLFGLPFTSASSGSGNYLGTARLSLPSPVWIGQVTLGTNSAVINATFPTNSTTTTASNMTATVPVNPLPSGASLAMSLTYQTA